MLKKVSKGVIAVGSAAVTVAATAVPALAVGVANESVTGALSTQSDNIVATMNAAAPFGVAILAIFLAWKFGKKLFKTVAN